MRKVISTQVLLLLGLIYASPVYAQADDVSKITTFGQNINQILITLSTVVAMGFFIWGGYSYMTSSGDPEKLSKSKKTLINTAVGLAIVYGALVLVNIVKQVSTGAFGG